MKAVITVVGKDKVGIIAKISEVLATHHANIVDISQTILQDYFTMIMIVDLKSINIMFKELKEELDKVGKSLELSINIQHENIFKSMHTI